MNPSQTVLISLDTKIISVFIIATVTRIRQKEREFFEHEVCANNSKVIQLELYYFSPTVQKIRIDTNSFVSKTVCDEHNVSCNIIDLIHDTTFSLANAENCDEVKNVLCESSATSRVDNITMQHNDNEMQTAAFDGSLFNLDDLSVNIPELSNANINFDDITNVVKKCSTSNTDLAIINNLLEKDNNESEVFDLDEFNDLLETVSYNGDITNKDGSCTEENTLKEEKIKEIAASSRHSTDECLSEFESILDEYRVEKGQSIDSQTIQPEAESSINEAPVALVESEEKNIELKQQSSIVEEYQINENQQTIEPEQDDASSSKGNLHISETENKNELRGTKERFHEFAQIEHSTDKNENTPTSNKGHDELLNVDKINVSITSSKSIISISSNDTVTEDVLEDIEDIKTLDSDSDCDGYHSSDFEFITEAEAELDGLIINCSKKQLKTPKKGGKSKVLALGIAKETSSNQESLKNDKPGLIPSTSKDTLQNQDPEVLKRQYQNQKAYYIRLRQQYTIKEMQNSRENHVIPNDGDYVSLFQGSFAPADFHFVENKSVLPNTSMNAQYRGLGFDMAMLRQELEVDRQYQDEAKESAKRILEMYPGLNRKRRRRH